MASDTGTSLHDRPVIPVLTSGGTASEPFPAHLGKRYLPQPSVHRRNDLQSSHRRCLSPSLLSSILPLVIDLVRVPPTVPNTPYKPYNRPLTASCHQRAPRTRRNAAGTRFRQFRHRNASGVRSFHWNTGKHLFDYLDGVKSTLLSLFLFSFFFLFFFFFFNFFFFLSHTQIYTFLKKCRDREGLLFG